MKFSVMKIDLLKTLSHIAPIAERKSTIPILSNAKFEAGNELTVTATNVDLELIEKVPATIMSEGKTTVPAHILYDIARKLPDGEEIVFDVQGDQMVLTAGKAKFKLPCLSADDFPMMAGANLPFKFTISPDDIISLIDKTKFAISNEETRYYLNGIYLHSTEKNGQAVLRGVATDGHRLSLYDIPCPEGAKGIPGIIIPKQVVAELRKLLDDGGDSITMEVSETKTRFSFPTSVMTSKLIDGKFPDYNMVIPKTNDKKMEADCKVFKESVDRISAVSLDKFKAIKMGVKDGQADLSASTPEAGSGTEDIEVAYNSATPLEISFKARYLLEIASQIESEKIEFTFSDGNSPCVIRESGNDSFLYVLMPLRM